MSLNLINTTSDNVRLKIVPRDGATITLGEGNQNPTAFINADGSLIACFGKAIFHCVPQGIEGGFIRTAGEKYYDDYPDMATRWALTATTYLANGTVETNTYRWIREDRNYSDHPLKEPVSSGVKWDDGNAAHFQAYSDWISAAGDEGDDPKDWVIVKWHATPDLQDGELDYFTVLLQPLLNNDTELEIIACGKQKFPGM